MDAGKIIFEELNKWVYNETNEAGEKLHVIDASDLHEIIPEIVKKLNEPAVSKSEGIERRNLLIDFGNRVVEIQNEHQCLLQNVEKEVDKYLKSINNC